MLKQPPRLVSHHLLPHLAGHLEDRAVARDAGIVDDDVDRAELGLDLRHARLARVEIADVPFVGLDAGALGEGLRALVVAGIIGGDGHARSLQREADRLADAARAARDDRYACHHPLSLSFAPNARQRSTQPASSRANMSQHGDAGLRSH